MLQLLVLLVLSFGTLSLDAQIIDGANREWNDIDSNELDNLFGGRVCSCVDLIFLVDISDSTSTEKGFQSILALMNFTISKLVQLGAVSYDRVAVLDLTPVEGDDASITCVDFGSATSFSDIETAMINKRDGTTEVTLWLQTMSFLRMPFLVMKTRPECRSKVVIISDFDVRCTSGIVNKALYCDVPTLNTIYQSIDTDPTTDICNGLMRNEAVSPASPNPSVQSLAGVYPVQEFSSYVNGNHSMDFFRDMFLECVNPPEDCPVPTGPAEDCDLFNDPADYCRQCMNGTSQNQLDYYPDPCNCTRFFHCFFNGSDYEGILKDCPAGQAWSQDQKVLNCLPLALDDDVANADQPRFECLEEDPCHTNQTVIDLGYWVDDNCGIFYQCSNYHSNRKCCPLFHSFNLTSLQCDINNDCLDHEAICNITGITVPMLAPTISSDNQFCTDQFNSTRAVDPNASPAGTSFLTRHPNGTLIVEFCAPNTTFRIESCKCDAFGDAREFEEDTCFLNITCDNSPMQDSSPQNQYIDNNGVEDVDTQVSDSDASSYCRFNGPNGTGWVELPFFQSNSFGSNLSACWWFRWEQCDDGGVPESNQYVLFSGRGPNRLDDNDIEPNILVRTVPVAPPGSLGVAVTIRTTSNATFTATSGPLACPQWQQVCFTYGGTTLQVYLDASPSGAAEQTDGRPIFWMNHCPFIIGRDEETLDGRVFDGCMDEILWCRETFSQQRIADLRAEQVGDFPTIS